MTDPTPTPPNALTGRRRLPALLARTLRELVQPVTQRQHRREQRIQALGWRASADAARPAGPRGAPAPAAAADANAEQGAGGPTAHPHATATAGASRGAATPAEAPGAAGVRPRGEPWQAGADATGQAGSRQAGLFPLAGRAARPRPPTSAPEAGGARPPAARPAAALAAGAVLRPVHPTPQGEPIGEPTPTAAAGTDAAPTAGAASRLAAVLAAATARRRRKVERCASRTTAASGAVELAQPPANAGAGAFAGGRLPGAGWAGASRPDGLAGAATAPPGVRDAPSRRGAPSEIAPHRALLAAAPPTPDPIAPPRMAWRTRPDDVDRLGAAASMGGGADAGARGDGRPPAAPDTFRPWQRDGAFADPWPAPGAGSSAGTSLPFAAPAGRADAAGPDIGAEAELGRMLAALLRREARAHGIVVRER